MPNLRALQRKMKTAADLLSVVKTMKSLASVNIRHFEKAVESLEDYTRTIDLAWTVFLTQTDFIPATEPAGSAVFFVIGTDQGMCGQYNEMAVEKALSAEQEEDGRTEILYWTAGERLESAFLDSGKESMLKFELPGSLDGIDKRVMEVVRYIEIWSREREIRQFFLIHNATRKGGGYFPTFSRILPLDREWAEKYTNQPWGRKNLPQINIPGRLFFRNLFRQYLYISLFRAFSQSLAGENAARLASMQSA
ncbi:MAG: FoF1 ATP synthase subunit gamma, partial [Desulfovibrionales bacterium]